MEKQQNRNFGKHFAISSQPLRISQCVGNQFAISFRIAKFASHMHCSFVSHKNFKTLAKIRIANFANHIANFANHIANFANHIANFANHIAKFATHCQIRNPLPNSLALRNSHLQALSSSVINATDFQTW